MPVQRPSCYRMGSSSGRARLVEQLNKPGDLEEATLTVIGHTHVESGSFGFAALTAIDERTQGGGPEEGHLAKIDRDMSRTLPQRLVDGVDEHFHVGQVDFTSGPDRSMDGNTNSDRLGLHDYSNERGPSAGARRG